MFYYFQLRSFQEENKSASFFASDLATGVHGEQLCQTNYQQHEAGDDVAGMRGSYSERWNIYWITAHFLTAAAGFEELGVDWKAFQ